MYSFGGKSQSNSSSSTSSSGSLKNFDFDFAIGGGSSNRGSSRPLRDQKTTSGSSNFSSFSSSSSSSSSYSSTWTPNKPSWTHQPSPAATTSSGARSGLQNPTAMVGDIFGKSWSSTTTSSSGGLGNRSSARSDSSLFGDLVGSAIGQGKSGIGGKVPLKSATQKSTFSTGSLSDSLPKATPTAGSNNLGNSQSRGSPENWANNFPNSGSRIGNPIAQPVKPAGRAPSTKQDPFGSLVDFSSKPNPKPSQANKPDQGNFSFGGFQDSNKAKTGPTDADFDIFNVPSNNSSSQPPKINVDPLDSLFSSVRSSANTSAAEIKSSNQTVQTNDWDLGAEFGGNDSGGDTIELQDLPPPPAGVSFSIAMSKGSDSYKQGQFADGIKWLSWAFLLLEKSGDKSSIAEVLTCRASCYKEVGEYKKAIADCSKVSFYTYLYWKRKQILTFASI